MEMSPVRARATVGVVAAGDVEGLLQAAQDVVAGDRGGTAPLHTGNGDREGEKQSRHGNGGNS